jgi:pimeloyl-ACP methyl ester carboxylesterase
MDAQVRALARNVGRPVAIVAESEGALVAADYAATSPDFPVDRIVMESPLIDPARVYYPPRGRQGWGVASGWLMRGIAAAVNGLSAHQFPPDAPLFRSIVDGGPALRGLRTCPSRGARRTVLFPLADAVAAPFATTSDVDVRVVPAFHGGLLTNDAARRTILLALRGRYIARHPLLEQASVAVRAAASAWHVPPLPDALNPAWRGSKVRCAPIG